MYTYKYMYTYIERDRYIRHGALQCPSMSYNVLKCTTSSLPCLWTTITAMVAEQHGSGATLVSYGFLAHIHVITAP